MTDQNIVTLLLEHFKCRFPRPINNAADLLAMENNLLALTMDLCRQVSEEALKAAGTGYQGTSLSKCAGQKARFVGFRNREIHGLFGKIKVKRAYYHGAKGGTFPLDHCLGIESGITPSCLFFLTQFTARDVFGEGLQQFNRVFRPCGPGAISTRKAMLLSKEVGADLERLRQEEVSIAAVGKAEAYHDPIAARAVVSIDATKIREKLGEYLDEKGRKKQEIGWKDAKIASVSVPVWNVQREECRLTRTTYVAAEEHADLFFSRLDGELRKRLGDPAAHQLIFICDGALWIWDRIRDTGVNRIEILDFYHACEHLMNVAEVLEGKESAQARERFKLWKELTWKGRIDLVMEQMDAILQTKPSAAVHKVLKGQLEYFRNNEARMRYDLYREMQLPIGSGTIESACKNVIGGRMKAGGMIWSETGADAMLQIRASLKSGTLEADFGRFFLPQAA